MAAKKTGGDKWAVLRAGGRQYEVREGDELVVDRVGEGEGERVKWGEVLLVGGGESRCWVGTPLVEGAYVEGKVMGQERGEKIRVAKYKAKTAYRRVRGFRSELSRVRVEKIVKSDKG